MSEDRSSSSREFCVKVGDKYRDAELHEPILAAGDEAAAREIAKRVARRAGLTEAEIEMLYSEK